MIVGRRDLGGVNLGRRPRRNARQHPVDDRPRGVELLIANGDGRLGQPRRQIAGVLRADFLESLSGSGDVSVDERAPRRIETFCRRRGSRRLEADAGIDEISHLARRRDFWSGHRRWRLRPSAGEREEHEEKKSSPFQSRSSISRRAAVNVSFGFVASSQQTFRSARSHVICRFAYARVRRFVSAMASSIFISPATTAAASA